jgi:putative FmdB family regulatory protein
MPIFEYNCQSCEHHFETIVMSAGEKIACPKCESKKVAKQFSVFSSPSSSSSAEAAPSGGGCAFTPSTCGCH